MIAARSVPRSRPILMLRQRQFIAPRRRNCFAAVLETSRFRSYCRLPARTPGRRPPHADGDFGVAGQRRANFAVQNSDFVVAIGAGLELPEGWL